MGMPEITYISGTKGTADEMIGSLILKGTHTLPLKKLIPSMLDSYNPRKPTFPYNAQAHKHLETINRLFFSFPSPKSSKVFKNKLNHAEKFGD